MNKKILAALMALCSTSGFAVADTYQIRIPARVSLGGASGSPEAPAEPTPPPESPLSVALSSHPTLAARVGAPYAFDLSSLLSISGGTGGYDLGEVAWSLHSGALPAGIALTPDGKLSGMPTMAGTESFQLKASYRTAAGEQSYQIVVGDIVVDIANAMLPPARFGAPYAYDFNPLLSVEGDASYSGAGVTWAVLEGSLPAGLVLSTEGQLSGTPSETRASEVRIEARYKHRGGAQDYTVSVDKAGITLQGAYRTWEDGTLAKRCLDYRQGDANHAYTGATGDGIYRIQPQGQSALSVYCDMTTNGGGYTVIMVVRDSQENKPALEHPAIMASPDSPPVPGSNVWAYLPGPAAIALANSASEIRIHEPGTSNAVWSSHPEVLGNLRAGKIANFNDEPFDQAAYWQQSAPGLTEFSNTCTNAIYYNSYYPAIFWGACNTKALHVSGSVTDGQTYFAANWDYMVKGKSLVVSYR